MSRLTAVIAVLMAAHALLFAQYQTSERSKLAEQLRIEQEKQRALQQSEIEISGQVLEKPVDPEQYMVGPGDVLSVNIYSGMEQRFMLTVSPEGILSIPTVGDLEVYGKTLAVVKGDIVRSVKRVYSSGSVTAQLTQLRKFRVPVSGIVNYPGVYEASAADRVSHLLDKAGRLIVRVADETEKKRQPGEITSQEEPVSYSSFRNIYLVHKSGDTTLVDYLMFQRSLSKSHNPFVSEGDAIYVPPISEDIGTIQISGRVRIPGTIEYNCNDRIRDIIKISGGFLDDALLDSVYVTRCIGRTARYTTHILQLTAGSSDWDFELKSDDRILVKPIYEYHLKNQVYIDGEVLHPGTYSIVEKETELSEVISAAGGFTPEANTADIEIVRTSAEEISDPEFERLKLVPIADMTEMEYEYFKTKSREKFLVVSDFQKLFNNKDSSYDILLRDGDQIHVPLMAKTVRVSGQVLKPGLISWRSGMNYLEYIKKCGGYSYNARKSKVRIIRASTGTWVKPSKSTVVNIGDTIFIPEKPERDYWIITKDIILVLTQMVTIIVLITTISK